MKSLGEIAEFLRAQRARQGLAQTELAAHAGISLRSYQRLEAGNPGARLATLLRACNALGVELNASSARRPTLDDLGPLYGHDADAGHGS